MLLVTAAAAFPAAADGESGKSLTLADRGLLMTVYEQEGAAAVPELRVALDDERPLVYLTAVHLLAKLGEPALSGIAKALDHPVPEVRRVAIEALAEIGHLADYWDTIIMDDDPGIRLWVRLSLSRCHSLPVGAAFDRFFDSLMQRYEKAPEEQRESVVAFFAAMDPLAPEVKRFLAAATKDPSEKVRAAAYDVILERMDTDWGGAADALTSGVNRGEEDNVADIATQSARNVLVALAMGRKKDNYERALALAESITDRPYSVYARMRLMMDERKYAGLVNAFTDEDISAWPYRETPEDTHYRDKDIRVHALLHRGEAFLKMGAGAAAEKDFNSALELATHKEMQRRVLYWQAQNRAGNLGDSAGAVDAYSKLLALKGGRNSRYYQALIAVANHLRGEQQFEAAIDKLQTVTSNSDRRGSWHESILILLARTLMDAGRHEEAATAFEKALGFPAARREHRTAALLGLGEIQAKSGNIAEAMFFYQRLADDGDAKEEDRAQALQALEKLQLLHP